MSDIFDSMNDGTEKKIKTGQMLMVEKCEEEILYFGRLYSNMMQMKDAGSLVDTNDIKVTIENSKVYSEIKYELERGIFKKVIGMDLCPRRLCHLTELGCEVDKNNKADCPKCWNKAINSIYEV